MKLADILVIIVIYNIEFVKSSTYLSLEECLDGFDERLDLLIYDNSPCAFQDVVHSQFFNVMYQHDASNPGVSKAYNIGGALSHVLDKKYLIFFDQDSVVESDYLRSVIKTIELNPKDELFSPFVMQKQTNVLISPSLYKNFRGRLISLKSDLKYLKLEGVSMINSGMTISLSLFDRAGGFDESIKLDFSDHDFVFRVSKCVYRIVMIPVTLYHSLSSFETPCLESDLYRYKMYLNGGRIFSRKIDKYFIFLCVSFGRCLLLTVKTRSMVFLKEFVNEVFNNEG